MIYLQKNPSVDFKILNLSDPQLMSHDWKSPKHTGIIKDLMDELLSAEKPDLITVSGDLNLCGDDEGYYEFADFIDSYNIPWAFVWGNHDDQGGLEPIERILGRILKCKNVLFERGDPALGNGNYIIGIKEGEKPVTALFMLDAHDQSDFVNSKGEHRSVWARLYENQLDWLESESTKLKADGYKDSALILHIPIYAYNDAFKAAFSGICDPRDVDPQKSMLPEYWNEDYKDSFGVMREDICSYPADEGALEHLIRTDFIKNVICGHDHVNNFSILYKGIRLTYSMKLGIGCYSHNDLLGGTYITVSSDGVKDIHHRYYDPSKYFLTE